jgi:protein TonB
VEFVEPEYPVEARRRGLEGDVAVKVLVGPKGEVLEAEVVKGVDPLLDEAALEAARRSRWTPGSQRGTPVKAWMLLPYRFELK